MSSSARPRRPVIAALLLVATLASGCGERSGVATVSEAGAEPANLVPDDYEGRFRAVGTVLESPQHGPQLCHAVAESYPPQCGGPDVAGWDWDPVGAESANGTTWGSYTLVGTFDGQTFTLTEPPTDNATIERPSPEGPDFETPCAEPAGGWTPVDPGRATDAAFEAAVQRAQGMDGYGGLWIDQRIPAGEISEENANDPQRFVLNVTTTGDPAEVERVLREVWGGALCVAPAARSESDLLAVQEQVDVPGQLGSSSDVRTGQVVVDVLVATEALQADLDAEHGPGAVRLHGVLEPLD